MSRATGGRAARVALWTLTALGTAAAELATAEPGEPIAWAAGRAIGLVAGALGLARLLRRLDGPAPRREAIGAVAAALAFALPLLIAGAGVLTSGRSRTLDLVLVEALRNLGLVLAAAGGTALVGRLAALTSVFLVLVAASVADGPVVAGVVGAYAVAGASYLVLSDWSRLRLVGGEARSRRPPLAAAGTVATVLGLVVGLAALGPAGVAATLAGLLPSAGGSEWSDPEARAGVGDGDNEVAGSEDPQSIGFSDSEIYLESDRPSLYDAVNDQYGEAYRRKKQDRMISIAPTDIREQDSKAAENLQAGREFSAVRRPPPRGTRPGERDPRALVYLKGPTPAHLPLAAFDRFDGRDWLEAPARPTLACSLNKEPGGWLRLDWPRPPIFAGPVEHQVKVGALDTAGLPSPPHLERFRLGAVDRPDFFAWAQDGLMRMAGRTIPAGSVIHSVCLTVDTRRLREIAWESQPLAPDPSIAPEVAAMAREWAGEAPRGWAQVEAVVERLRLHAEHDRSAVVPADCDDVVAHFLLRARRGPDYLFASSAVVLLRSLGYPTRLVSGLYADPARYDPRTRHTPIDSLGVHTWAEVLVPGGAWVAVEPTPGYAMLGPALALHEQLVEAARQALAWSRRNAAGLGLATLVLALAWRVRGNLRDAAATLAWHLTPGRDPAALTLRTLRLIERRAALSGLGRPSWATPRRWYGRLSGGALGEFLDHVDRGLFAPEGPGPDAPMVCRRAVAQWPLARFRTLARPNPEESAH